MIFGGKMTIIAPSLLSADFMNLKDEIEVFNDVDDFWFHLDIMDGHFVPNLTFGVPVLKELKNNTKQKLDAHFMVKNPTDYIDWFKNLGIYNFTFHWETTDHHDRMIQAIKKEYESCGISINPLTDVSVIPDYILSKIDLILVMSVNPGFGGQSFIPGAIDKVKELAEKKKKLNAHFEIQVDGGVINSNAKELIDNGATNLVAGSYIFKDGPTTYLNKIDSLRKF